MNSFEAGKQAADTLLKVWNHCKYGGVVAVSTPGGLDFFDVNKTTPSEAIAFLMDEYGVSIETVARWCSQVNVNNVDFI